MAHLWQRIEERYERAQNLGAAFKTPTKIELERDPISGADFVIRISEALKQKPKSSSKEKKNPLKNPFLPYEKDLWVEDLSSTHVLLLNKFNLVDRHVLVVTRTFEDQNEPLTLEDVSATWEVLKCMPNGGIAFFNCGPHSGASQPHKHTQIVPLPLPDEIPLPLDAFYKVALNEANGSSLHLPFVAFGFKLNASSHPSTIHSAYLSLLESVSARMEPPLETTSSDTEGQGGSYNVLWTQDWFVLIPRSSKSHGPCSLKSCKALYPF